MNSSQDPWPRLTLLHSFLAFLLGLADDALIIGLSRFGSQVVGMRLLILTCTLTYLLSQMQGAWDLGYLGYQLRLRIGGVLAASWGHIRARVSN